MSGCLSAIPGGSHHAALSRKSVLSIQHGASPVHQPLLCEEWLVCLVVWLECTFCLRRNSTRSSVLRRIGFSASAPTSVPNVAKNEFLICGTSSVWALIFCPNFANKGGGSQVEKIKKELHFRLLDAVPDPNGAYLRCKSLTINVIYKCAKVTKAGSHLASPREAANAIFQPFRRGNQTPRVKHCHATPYQSYSLSKRHSSRTPFSKVRRSIYPTRRAVFGGHLDYVCRWHLIKGDTLGHIYTVLVTQMAINFHRQCAAVFMTEPA